MPRKLSYKILTFGCQMNQSDSERIAAYLDKLGFKNSDDWRKLDLLVFTTCSVRKSAENRVIGLINMLTKNHPVKKDLKIILTGCMLYHDLDYLEKQFKRPVFCLPIKKLNNWDKELIKSFPGIMNSEFRIQNFFGITPEHNSKFQAYVPISFGCNNFCAYCVVPYAREREESRPMKEIYQEVKDLVERGYKEITLLGQNVNSYQDNSEFRILNSEFTESFPRLLELLNSIKGDFWIRFLTSHPKDLSSQLIQAIASLDKVAKSLHLAVQSGDNQILQKMNRKYTVEHYIDLIKEARKAIPELTVSTDIIVGFPGETKKQFENTVKLFKKIQFDMAYINRYSPREKTAAFRLKDDVPLEEKKSRDRELNKVLAEIAKKKNQKWIETGLRPVCTVLVEKKKNGYWSGKDNGFRTVKFKGGNNLIGKFMLVKITKGLSFGLEGRFSHEMELRRMKKVGDLQCRTEDEEASKMISNLSRARKLVVILGPTASGKTAWAKELMKKFQGEIISADSRQIYQGLDIGTAKDKKVAQFLIDIKRLNQKFTVSDYQKSATETMAKIWQRGHLPFLVGGTGLYISAVVDGYVLPHDKPDIKLRRKLESRSLVELGKELKKKDPVAYQKVDLKNKRRVVRALEVIIKTGQSIIKKRSLTKPDFDTLLIGIDTPREKLYQRINERVLKMIKEGLVDEVRKFYFKKYNFSQEAFSGIGYRQIAADFKNLSPKEIKKYQVPQKTIERIQADTRHYAKRQLTWFKRDKRINWVKNVGEAEKLIRVFIG